VEALDADASDAEQVAAAEAVTELVVANRVAIAEDFAQILPDLDIDAAAASIAADVEAGLEAPAGLDAGGEAVFDTIVAVQTNGAIVEALLENANATYELGLDVPGYMAPAVPDTADLESLLATASDSVAAVGALAVPATAAIQEIVDGQLAEEQGAMMSGDDAEGSTVMAEQRDVPQDDTPQDDMLLEVGGDTLVMEEESPDGMAQMPAEAQAGPMLASAAEMGEMPVMEDAQPVM
jgi:hypothetical protein